MNYQTFSVIIDKASVDHLKSWFEEFVLDYTSGDDDFRKSAKLKVIHTKNVCSEILILGKSLGLTDDELRLAEIIALLHDIGRFEQLRQYMTFSDGLSDDHADMGIRLIRQHGLLDHFSSQVRSVISRSVMLHNKPSLPKAADDVSLFYPRLIRDADKLDIWKVILSHYHRNDNEKNEMLTLNLPDTPGYSEKVYDSLLKGKIVDIKNVRNLNDFKLLQTGWIYDINFKPAFESIKNRRYLELTREVLPQTEKTDRIFISVMAYLEDRIRPPLADV